MALTGWTYAELRAAPAEIVRRLIWRIFADRVWDRELVAAARAPLPDGAGFEARIAKADAVRALGALEQIVFPEDGHG